MYLKFKRDDKVRELRTAAKAIHAGMAPCTVCKSLRLTIGFQDCLSSLLDRYEADIRRDRRVRRARRARVGNVIEFPSRLEV